MVFHNRKNQSKTVIFLKRMEQLKSNFDEVNKTVDLMKESIKQLNENSKKTYESVINIRKNYYKIRNLRYPENFRDKLKDIDEKLNYIVYHSNILPD